MHRNTAVALLLMPLVLAAAACARTPPTPEPPAAAARADAFTVRVVQAPDLKPVSATVASRDMSEARARIGGVLTRLLVREGDVVRQGQLIAVIEDARLKLETRAFDAQVAAAQAEASRASQDLARIRTLYEQGIYARARLDQAEASARSGAANVAAARAQRAASAEIAAQGAVAAPGPGKVIHAPVPAGSVVTAGQSIATITSGPTVLRIEMPESQGAALRTGDTVRIAPDAAIAAGASGVIRQVYPAVEAGRAVADIDAPGLEGALIGQRVTVLVTVGQRPAILVPARYVLTRYGLDYVRLIGRDGIGRETPIQTTASGVAGQIEVLSGLQAGDILAPAGPGQ